MYVNYYAMQ